MNAFIKVTSGEVLQIAYPSGLPRSAVGVHPSGKNWKNVDLRSYASIPDMLALFDWYPCILSGSGSLPDVSTIAWDAQSKTGSGVLVPMIESRVISVGDFTDKLDDAEFSAMIESSAPDVRRVWNRLKMRQNVDLDGPLITSFMAVLVTSLIVTQSRSDEILA